MKNKYPINQPNLGQPYNDKTTRMSNMHLVPKEDISLVEEVVE